MSMWRRGEKDRGMKFFFSFFPFEIFFGGGRLEGWWVDMEGLRTEWDGSTWCTTPKESLKIMSTKNTQDKVLCFNKQNFQEYS